MRQPALPWPMRFENIRACQYCDKEITGTAWVSSIGGQTVHFCSHQCKTLYERANGQQLDFRWDVT